MASWQIVNMGRQSAIHLLIPIFLLHKFLSVERRQIHGGIKVVPVSANRFRNKLQIATQFVTGSTHPIDVVALILIHCIYQPLHSIIVL